MLAALVGVLSLVLAVVPANAVPDPPGFQEHFSDPFLDASWDVLPYGGPVPRAHGFNLPANHYSLADNPGHLRYLLDPMTHHDGFVNGYATTSGEHSCCVHDAGLELHRQFAGEHWKLEAKATYYLPYANGRGLQLRVYFGDGSPGTYFVVLERGRECCVPQNWIRLMLRQQTGTTVTSLVSLEDVSPLYPPGPWDPSAAGPDMTTVWWRLERTDGVLAAHWSLDGIGYTQAWMHDLGSALDGLPQRVVLAGLSWFTSAGSYADWDFIEVTPTTLPLAIDFKPGSATNSINPRSKGKVAVAVLGQPGFPSGDLDVSSLRFGPGAAAVEHGGHAEDVDGDGLIDLLLHFAIPATGIGAGDTEACLTGTTLGGVPAAGCDVIRTVGG